MESAKTIGPEGLHRSARLVRSPNHDARPPGASISLLLLHAISLPAGVYGGDAIECLFTNRLEPDRHPSFRELAGLTVSSHFLVRRDGELVQFVAVQDRAWHAGASVWRGRQRCNDFSLGVELEGSEADAFTEAQYLALAELVAALRESLPLRHVAAHSDVAPGRKWDPGSRFDWTGALARLARR